MLRPGPGRALAVVLAAARYRPLPALQARIGPYILVAELVTALVLAVAAARASSGWELAALAWLALIAVPLAFIDAAVQRLPDLLTISAFVGTLVLLAAAEGTAHQPWLLVRAVIGAAALAGFYLALWLVFPDQLGLGDVKLAASIGLVLAWGSWSELFLGALAGALLGAVYARVLSARRGAGGPVYLPLGPFLLLGALAAIALLSSRGVPGGSRPGRLLKWQTVTSRERRVAVRSTHTDLARRAPSAGRSTGSCADPVSGVRGRKTRAAGAGQAPAGIAALGDVAHGQPEPRGTPGPHPRELANHLFLMEVHPWDARQWITRPLTGYRPPPAKTRTARPPAAVLTTVPRPPPTATTSTTTMTTNRRRVAGRP